MILNAVLCDWLRLTSFDVEDYMKMRDVWRYMVAGVELEEKNLMQYGGKGFAHGFLGTGKQKRRQHYMISFSGSAASLAYHELVSKKWAGARCTRIDAQLTIALPKGYKAEKLFNRLNGNVPYGRLVTLYRRGDWGATVYVGVRKTKNGRVTRIYVKEHAEGLALRFETEFKGDWADQNWIYLTTGGNLKSLLVTELESLGNIDFEPLSTFYGFVKGNYPAPIPRAVETSSPTLEWLLKTVDPVLRRMLNDHDHGTKVRHWLELLLDWSN